MMNYRELYFRLFGSLADVVEAMETSDYCKARELLVRAMQEAEECYIAEENENENKDAQKGM